MFPGTLEYISNPIKLESTLNSLLNSKNELPIEKFRLSGINMFVGISGPK